MDLDGKTFIVTGANSGIGQVTAAVIAGRGGRVFLGCRSREKAELAMSSLRAAAGSAALQLEAMPIDLADLASVRAAAESFRARGVPLHALINNAGVAGGRGLTRDGFELAFGVNHLGHFLLTRLLEAPLRAGAASRVVNVSSESHRGPSGLDFEALARPTGTRTGLHEYGVSKLCNVLFTRELGRRWSGTGVTAYAVHPGVVATAIWRRVPQPLRWLMTRFMISPQAGARTTVFCATAPELTGVTGRYYLNERESTPSAAAGDDALAARLWQESERLVGLA